MNCMIEWLNNRLYNTVGPNKAWSIRLYEKWREKRLNSNIYSGNYLNPYEKVEYSGRKVVKSGRNRNTI